MVTKTDNFLKYVLGLHCTEASPTSGLGHSQTSVRNGRVFATLHSALMPHDVGSQGFLHTPCKHARPGPHSPSISHCPCSTTKERSKIHYTLNLLNRVLGKRIWMK